MTLITSMRQRDCPVCGAAAATAALFLEASLDEARLTASSFSSRKAPEFMSYRLVRCSVCSTVFASEAPAARALADAYHAADYSSSEEAACAADVYGAMLAPFLEALPERGTALEIGTGTGVFLGHLQQLGFTTTIGIEPSHAAIAAADDAIRPCIREGVFTGDEFAANSIALACCFMTLEHVPEPRAFVEAAFRMLIPGGIVALITHDYTAGLNRLLGRRSPIIDIEHLQLFCPQALQHLVRDAGYNILGIRSIRNVYPLNYWLTLLPLPEPVKHVAQTTAAAARLASRRIGMNVGNLLTVAQKPL